MRLAPDDLTARARVRDAAILVFGESGFDASVRTIAERAGVSAALVMHHFGSKENLRSVCDEHIAALIADIKKDSVTPSSATALLSQLGSIDEYGWILAYVMRSMAVGGRLASGLFEQMVSDAETYLEQGVAAGVIRASRDPAARARYYTLVGVGSLLLMVALEERGPDTDYAQIMHRWSEDFLLVSLESLTEGMFTDDSILRAYEQHSGTEQANPTTPRPESEDDS